VLDWADLVLAMDSTVPAELRTLTADRARPGLRLWHPAVRGGTGHQV
jgi:hypothetical protein